MDGKQYDYKKAYDKNLKPSARLHYLENARHDQDAPTNMCSPAHMKYEVKDINKNGKIDGWEQAKYDAINKSSDSPAKQVVDPLAQQQMVQPMTNLPPKGSSLVNPFSPQAQAVAQGVYGNQQMMQNAVGATPMFQKTHDEKGNFIGNTEEEQARLFNIKKRTSSKEYKDYKAAAMKKMNWENKENDYGFGNKKYPQQREVDSLYSVYKNKKF